LHGRSIRRDAAIYLNQLINFSKIRCPLAARPTRPWHFKPSTILDASRARMSRRTALTVSSVMRRLEHRFGIDLTGPVRQRGVLIINGCGK
jgi:hypothetical protein